MKDQELASSSKCLPVKDPESTAYNLSDLRGFRASFAEQLDGQINPTTGISHVVNEVRNSPPITAFAVRHICGALDTFFDA